MTIETITQTGYIVVDAFSGDDTTATRDSFANPFKTLSKGFAQVRDNDTILVYPGQYVETPLSAAMDFGQDSPFFLRGKSTVSVLGRGTPLIQLTAHGNGMLIENSNNITVDGLRFRGQGPLTQLNNMYFALLPLNGINECLNIRNCWFENSGNHGIGHLWGPRTTNNSVFENNKFFNGGNYSKTVLGRDGAALAVGGDRNRFYGNRFESWFRGIEIEASVATNPTTKILIHGNQFVANNYQSIYVNATHGTSSVFHDIIITENSFKGAGAPVPFGTGEMGIFFSGGHHAIISKNTMRDMYNGIGVWLASTVGFVRDIIVSDNVIDNVDRTGIHVSKLSWPVPPVYFPLSDCTVSGNIITNIGGRGIWVDGDRNFICNNKVSNLIWSGIYIGSGDKNIVKNNVLYNTAEGQYVDKGTNTISDNNVLL